MANIPEHRKWMYNRLLPGKRGYTDEFLLGVEEFVNYASTLPVYKASMKIRCPCSKCKNRVHLSADDVRVHLYRKGFEPSYWIWTCHSELPPSIQPHMNEGPSENNQYEQMVFDASGPSFFPLNVENDQDEEPHSSAKNFYELLDAARQPLSMNVNEETELAYTLRMMNIKTTFNIPQLAMDQIFQYINHLMGPDNRVPTRYYDAKKLLTKLGLGHEKIDCCVNNCMLYYKSEINDKHCKFCGETRFKPCPSGSTRAKEVPRKRMHYLPLIPRLQRLYASHSSASHMRWHYENHREPGIMCHPSDGEAWKHFDRRFPDFSVDPQNVRLGLCSDGFSPFGFNAKPYSCWPVMVVPYNLPPSMCMTTPYTFLTCIIPGPKNPKAKFDVYLQPLIDELQLLWETGVLTYDASLKQNFMMRAALMWTINDFPAYVMDVKGTAKNKDTPNARLDMKDVCNRPELELVEKNGRYLMPNASYSLNCTNQLAVYEWLRTLKLPDGLHVFTKLSLEAFD
ncbi:PREDICTED: uncharacterized protein LOC109180715 [Ipomoea nil]|uniref:uncharacterized protein LOC109180715 n=1 Tax=Ipomoea nil TaxID=35883 RepID=UPI00090168CB|nr:PREDICTED: uncharacterized protein LOC109180715 [Ipomoea nil]